MTIKDSKYVNIHSVNLFYVLIGEADGSVDEKNGNKYLTFADTNKIKKVLEKYTELWNKAKSVTEKINDKPGQYEKDYMKFKFNSDDDKILKFHNLMVIVRSVFEDDGKFYPQVFLDECLYEI